MVALPSTDDALIRQVAVAYGLPFDLLRAQVIQESGGDPNALRYEPAFFSRYIRNNPDAAAGRFVVFAACSLGLLQIMLETACEIGFSGQPWELFTPRVGLAWGAKHMASLVEWAGGDYKRALGAYNAGKGRWDSQAGKTYAASVYALAGRALA